MAIPPGYASNNSSPVIPTGYEALEGITARKRKLAESMLQAGLQGPGPNARSWTQLLGSLAQAFVGKRLGNQADNAEEDIRNQQLGEYQTATRAFDEDVKAGVSPEEMVARYGGGRYTHERSQMYADILEDKMKNQNKFKDPIRLQGPDGGFSTYQPNEAGEFKPLADGLQLPAKMENINGLAMALQETKPGTVLPQDPNNLGILGPDGKPTINQPLLGAKTQIAKAGAPSVSTVVQNQMAKELPGVITADLQKSRETARSATEMLPNIARARDALKGAITGFGANQRLDLARLGSALGITGDDAVQKTQILMQSMGAQMFPILAALRPASDTDLLVAQRMSGGDITLSSGAILSAMNAAEQAAKTTIKRHNRQVDDIYNIYNKDPDVGASVQTFRVRDPNLTPAERAREELARRRAGGGAGATQQTFP